MNGYLGGQMSDAALASLRMAIRPKHTGVSNMSQPTDVQARMSYEMSETEAWERDNWLDEAARKVRAENARRVAVAAAKGARV